MANKKLDIDKNHKLYNEYQFAWKKADAAFFGGEAFKTEYLRPFDNEDKDEYKGRLENCSYENHTSDIISRRGALIFGRPIVRTIGGKLFSTANAYSTFLKDVDGKGTHYEQFIKTCYSSSIRWGFCPVFIDFLSEDERNDSDERSALPYLRVLHPTELINWGIDKSGNLMWVLIKTVYTKQDSPLDAAKDIIEYRYVTNTEIIIYEEILSKITEKETIEHGHGFIPVVILYDVKHFDDPIIGISSISDSIDLSVKFYNQANWYDQNLYISNFNVLAFTPYPSMDGQNQVVNIGPTTPLAIAEGSSAPQWVSPNTGVSQVFDAKLKDMRRRIFELAEVDSGYDEDGNIQLSGEAYRQRRKPTEDSARRSAGQLEEFENLLWETIIKMDPRKSTIEVVVVYPEEFGIESSEMFLLQLKAVKDSGVYPEEFIQEMAMGILHTANFLAIDTKKREELTKLILEFRQTVESDLEATTKSLLGVG